MNHQIKTRALWFIKKEAIRILGDLERGVINKDQAIGSYTILFNIASGIENVHYMQTLCLLSNHIRSTNHFFNIRKKFTQQFADKEEEIIEEKEMLLKT